MSGWRSKKSSGVYKMYTQKKNSVQMYTQKKNSVQMYTQKKNSVQMYTHSRIIYEMNNEHISTQLSLSCIHCKKIFKTRQVKYNHLTMNRCPELKK